MRGIVICGLLLLVLALVGWVSFSNSDTHTGIQLNKAKVEEDSKKVLRAGEELVHDSATAVDKLVEETDKTPDNKQVEVSNP